MYILRYVAMDKLSYISDLQIPHLKYGDIFISGVLYIPGVW